MLTMTMMQCSQSNPVCNKCLQTQTWLLCLSKSNMTIYICIYSFIDIVSSASLSIMGIRSMLKQHEVMFSSDNFNFGGIKPNSLNKGEYGEDE